MKVTKLGYIEWSTRILCPECSNTYLGVYKHFGMCSSCYAVFVIEDED